MSNANTLCTGAIASAFSFVKQWKLFDKADELQPLGNAAIYKTSVVLYLMNYQRLSSDKSLCAAVDRFSKTAPVPAQSNVRLRNQTLSTKSGSCIAARKRLDCKVVDWLSELISNSIIEATLARYQTLPFRNKAELESAGSLAVFSHK